MKEFISKLWWNIQVFFVRITGDGEFWDRFEVLPPNKYTWEKDDYKSYKNNKHNK